ncbi:hypothetical protein ETAA8_06010 [Anatilimnocola aggregata]|uniref:DUF5666 domain-containing protein n=1 Tax=Anatilimnocola aggregata TaxID=2528021 RepID=A0A517Y5Y0_9BACT|nr:hypothetical protein [Anatilimnocola aggregata]QDU25532.1 hypothetical protein ETAA8_06010 [Anatilimnocola aggregata]
MKHFAFLLLALCCGSLLAQNQPSKEAPKDQPAKPVLKITPGQVIIPFDRMQRPWGELISVDLATRTGKFRRENTDEVITFTAMPYAELLHHATHGDLQDFRVGERAIFRLHENEKGEWVWLTYIQDEMNMMNGHKEFYHVDKLDAAAGQIVVTQGSADKTYIREAGIVINTDKETRFWKNGEPAKFADIQLGDKLRTKTHGVGKGKVRVAWEVFLDEASLLKFQAEQKAVHAERIAEQGAPGYVDAVADGNLSLTLFNEGELQVKQIKAGKNVRIAPAGVDRKPTAEPITAQVKSVKMMGRQCKVELTVTSPTDKFKPTELARVWAVTE